MVEIAGRSRIGRFNIQFHCHILATIYLLIPNNSGIGRSIEDPNPTTNQFMLDRQLASIYADLANRELIKNETMSALGITWLPEYEAVAVPDSQLVEISVVDTNPARAQAVANELANQLILNSPTGPQSDQQTRQAFINAQLDSFQTQIEETQMR